PPRQYLQQCIEKCLPLPSCAGRCGTKAHGAPACEASVDSIFRRRLRHQRCSSAISTRNRTEAAAASTMLTPRAAVADPFAASVRVVSPPKTTKRKTAATEDTPPDIGKELNLHDLLARLDDDLHLPTSAAVVAVRLVAYPGLAVAALGALVVAYCFTLAWLVFHLQLLRLTIDTPLPALHLRRTEDWPSHSAPTGRRPPARRHMAPVCVLSTTSGLRIPPGRLHLHAISPHCEH
ncbi:hypothetical protein CB0940_10954, partial [Cercospora beticola]